MNLGLVGRILKIVSGILILLWLFHSFTIRMQSITSLVFYIAIFIVGQVLVNRTPTGILGGVPSLPAGFNATYSDANIALDTAAGKVWLRDGSRSRVFDKSEILGIQALYDNMQGLPTMISGGVVTQGTTVKKNIRIDVQTKDLDHPTYTVRFRIKSLFTNTDRLYAEALTWANRLNAFLRS